MNTVKELRDEIARLKHNEALHQTINYNAQLVCTYGATVGRLQSLEASIDDARIHLKGPAKEEKYDA